MDTKIEFIDIFDDNVESKFFFYINFQMIIVQIYLIKNQQIILKKKKIIFKIN